MADAKGAVDLAGVYEGVRHKAGRRTLSESVDKIYLKNI